MSFLGFEKFFGKKLLIKTLEKFFEVGKKPAKQLFLIKNRPFISYYC